MVDIVEWAVSIILTLFLSVELYELQELAATVNTNSHGLGSVGTENTDVALGLFPVLSMFNHSCQPNCCFSGTGGRSLVRTSQRDRTLCFGRTCDDGESAA